MTSWEIDFRDTLTAGSAAMKRRVCFGLDTNPTHLPYEGARRKFVKLGIVDCTFPDPFPSPHRAIWVMSLAN
jgi:hypothetical protein